MTQTHRKTNTHNINKNTIINKIAVIRTILNKHNNNHNNQKQNTNTTTHTNNNNINIGSRIHSRVRVTFKNQSNSLLKTQKGHSTTIGAILRVWCE